MANHMAEIAKMLGVEVGKEFECNDGTICVFTSNGTFVVKHRTNNHDASNHIFGDLVTGVLTIVPKPWQPEDDEEFYIVGYDGKIMMRYWEHCTSYLNYYKLGNCYRTKEEAEANRDKWIAFYELDEVLEV